ncbi:MAG TPA: UDP-glucuronic acid decarboxylase family protein [bacterium]|jgi:dTDP-glucose 4,6-dehydratase|nr:UDP-glucuronic acid decarboxylase family protein [bacterium]
MAARACITGGAGFLGSHLCDRLLAEGFEVVCIDNLLTGTPQNVSHLLDHPRFTFVRGDVTKPLWVEGPVDYVLHFGSPASPKDYVRYPIHTLKVGALGTHHTLGLAKAKGAGYLLASSSEVYGDPQISPQPETYWGHVNPVGVRSVYDEAKRFGEALATAYYHTHGLAVRIARIFNTYGPRMRADDGRAVPTFIGQALAGEPLTVYGTGLQTRSLCYVTDTVDGLFRLLVSPDAADDSPASFPVNLGSVDEITMRDLAELIIRITRSRSRISYEPLPPDDPKVRRPDISRAARLLGWAPRVSLADGLAMTIDYFRQGLAAGAR